MLLVTLHGFWGVGKDFSTLAGQLLSEGVITEWWGPDLLEPGDLGPAEGLSHWTALFTNQLAKRAKGKQVFALGYSMGGRLLLHALKYQGQHYNRAVVVSSHPGLETAEEIEHRRQWELSWSTAFKEKSWEELWTDWNKLEVLKSKVVRPTPEEHSYSRECLGQALANWATTQHLVCAQDFRRFPLPLHWISGENDTKYAELYQNLKNKGEFGEVSIIPGAGHRVHLDQPEILAQVVRDFFRA